MIIQNQGSYARLSFFKGITSKGLDVGNETNPKSMVLFEIILYVIHICQKKNSRSQFGLTFLYSAGMSLK
ncbi:hypothetical protein [Pelosinus fermentans]|uniref:Uncharacterized protein n=1 Tax=Pelosinus fermentans JBW45 TaxID=1192197 RepID=I8TX42_9FIRM|nr:hypothetical protein [Pelosinus fermentans]AJQ26296.1 hypothetical protein JBW_00944 [Pelosinus fermentans JBW45]